MLFIQIKHFNEHLINSFIKVRSLLGFKSWPYALNTVKINQNLQVQ